MPIWLECILCHGCNSVELKCHIYFPVWSPECTALQGSHVSVSKPGKIFLVLQILNDHIMSP